MKSNTLTIATLAGLNLQVVMVCVGHYFPPARSVYAFGGMGFSLLAGLLFALLAEGGWRRDLVGGAVAGGCCGLIGIAVAVLVHDVPPSLLSLGSLASCATGAIGGALGRLLTRPGRRAL